MFYNVSFIKLLSIVKLVRLWNLEEISDSLYVQNKKAGWRSGKSLSVNPLQHKPIYKPEYEIKYYLITKKFMSVFEFFVDVL